MSKANIWSHIIATAIFVAGLLLYLRLKSFAAEGPLAADIAAISLYFLAVVACFLSSFVFHTLSDHSPEVHAFSNQLDHFGIVSVLWGTGVSSTYFTFYCEPILRYGYSLALTAAGLGCAIVTLGPWFRRPPYRSARFWLYCSLGASTFAPLIHGWAIYGFDRLEAMTGVSSFFGLAAINFSGAIMYATRIPERWSPGTFDIFGQSHNWLHILVIFGALVRLEGVLAASERWRVQAAEFGLCQSLP